MSELRTTMARLVIRCIVTVMAIALGLFAVIYVLSQLQPINE
jgi:hypothetical protein